MERRKFTRLAVAGIQTTLGDVVDLSWMNQDWLKQNYLQSWIDMGTMPGPDGDILTGIWARYNGKSQVW